MCESSGWIARWHVTEFLEPSFWPQVSNAHALVERVVGVLQSLHHRVVEEKHIVVLEEQVRTNTPVVVALLFGESLSELSHQIRFIACHRRSALKSEVERQFLRRAAWLGRAAESDVLVEIIQGS